MKIGMLTANYGGPDLDTVIAFASENGFDCLEVAAGPRSKHLDPTTLTQAQADEIKKKLEAAKLSISSLAAYINVTDADPAKRQANIEHIHKCIDAAAMLGVDVVCTMAGMPVPGKTRMQTIEEECTKVFPGILRYAASRGIKIALENWTATNIMHLGHWERLFELVPDENFGLNFDPSHLVWQGIDYIAAVDRFAKRIFHTHAKDTEINYHHLRWFGNQEGGWWRYVIPGLGVIKWGEYIGALRRNGYNGVLSIEHEDSTRGPAEGFILGKNYLKLFA